MYIYFLFVESIGDNRLVLLLFSGILFIFRSVMSLPVMWHECIYDVTCCHVTESMMSLPVM